MTDLWTEASYDAEAENMARRVTAARVSAVDVWPFLAGAESEADYANRKAIVADRLDSIVSAMHPNDPVGFGVVRSSLEASFDQDFHTLHEARLEEQATRRRVEARVAEQRREEEVRARVEANLQREAQSKAKPGEVEHLDNGAYQRSKCQNCGGTIRRKNQMSSGWTHATTNTKYCPEGKTSAKTAAEGGQWKAQVAGNGEQVWSENSLRFDTEEEARKYIADLSMRWFGFDLGRVVPADTPNREPVDLSDPKITHNFRTGSKTAGFPPAGDAQPAQQPAQPAQEAAPKAVERRVDQDPETGEFVGSEWVEKEGDPNTLVQSDTTFGKNPRFQSQEEAEGWKAETSEEEQPEEAEESAEKGEDEADTTKTDPAKTDVPEKFDKKNVASKTASDEEDRLKGGKRECPDCGGTGSVPQSGGEPEDEVDEGYVQCKTCGGSGEVSYRGLDDAQAAKVAYSDDPNSPDFNDFDPNAFNEHNFGGQEGSREVDGVTVHTFASTDQAYNESQVSDSIKDGDVLYVPSEGVAGVLNEAWPIAVTEQAGAFHVISGGYTIEGIEGGKYAHAAEVARQVAGGRTASRGRHPFAERTAAREVIKDSGGKSYVSEKSGGQERRYYSDGSVTVLDTRKKSGTNRVILHTGPNPDRIPEEFKTSASRTALSKPMMCVDGHTWEESKGSTCPTCGKPGFVDQGEYRERYSHLRTAETHAPYRIQQDGDKWKVVNDIGETKGTHDSKEEAREHQKALYANVEGASEQAEKKSSAKDLGQCSVCSAKAVDTIEDGGKTLPVCYSHWEDWQREEEGYTASRTATADLKVGDPVWFSRGHMRAHFDGTVAGVSDDAIEVQGTQSESTVRIGRDALARGEWNLHRRAAANPYSVAGNPYVEPMRTPGTPDDVLDGPPDPNPPVLDMPMTTRPRQTPNAGQAIDANAPVVPDKKDPKTMPTARRNR